MAPHILPHRSACLLLALALMSNHISNHKTVIGAFKLYSLLFLFFRLKQIHHVCNTGLQLGGEPKGAVPPPKTKLWPPQTLQHARI